MRRTCFLLAAFIPGCLEIGPGTSPTNDDRELRFDEVSGELMLIDRSGVLAADLSSLESDADADATNERIAEVSFADATLTIREGDRSWQATFPEFPADEDADPTNELVSALTFENLELTVVQPGGSEPVAPVDLSSIRDDADADPENELQTLSFNEPTGALTIVGGNSVSLYPQPQELSFDEPSSELVLTGGGGSVVLPLPMYQRTLVVSPVGAPDPLRNGVLLRAAIEERAGELDPPPSATMPVVVRVEPGTYHLGERPLEMRRFVDLVGAGPGATRITGDAPGVGPGRGVIQLADDSELRGVTVENLATSATATSAVVLTVEPETAWVRVRDAELRVQGPIDRAAGTYFEEIKLVELERVDIIVTGGTAESEGLGVHGQSTAVFRDGRIVTNEAEVRFALSDRTGSSTDFRVANSLLDGKVSAASSACVATVDRNHDPLPPDCF